MEEQLFELLKIRMQRNSCLLEEFVATSGDVPGAGKIQDLFSSIEEWIRSAEQNKKKYEDARTQLAEILALQDKIKKSWRWRIGNKVIGTLSSLFFLKGSKNNAFSRLDELLAGVKSTLDKTETAVEPYRFAEWSGQFADPVVFHNVPEIKKNKVAIIVLNRNGEEHLTHLFSSFTKHNTYPDFEFILVDHDSSDKSHEIIESYKKSLPVRSIFFKQNFTFSYSNNYAAGQTDAEYLFFLNNDIIFDHDVITGLVKVLKEDPGAGIAAPCLYFPDDQLKCSVNLQHSGIRFYYRNRISDHFRRVNSDPPAFHLLDYKNSYRFRDTIVPVNSTEAVSGLASRPAICAAAMMCRRDDFFVAGGFDENYIYGYEDVDLSLVFDKKLGKELILAGDLWMIHNESYTRRREGLYKSSLKIFNQLILTHRFGYYLRIQYLADLFSGSRFWTDKRPLVDIIAGQPPGVNKQTDIKVKFLTDLFSRHLGWQITSVGYDEAAKVLPEADIAIFTDEDIPSSILTRAKDNLTVIRWPGENTGDFPFDTAYNDVFKEFMASSPGLNPAPEKLKYPDPDPFREYILDLVTNHLHIAVKLPETIISAEESGADIINLISLIFKDERYTLRIDQPGNWYDQGTLADNVVISFAAEGQYIPQPGQINVLWLMPGYPGDKIPFKDFYDLIISEDEFKDQPRLQNHRIRTVKPNKLKEALWSVHREKAGL